jgi:translation initiation factor 1 (eIF-1/SUI1)
MSHKIFNNEEQSSLNFLQDKKNIIISIQQRTAKKSLTKIEGLEDVEQKNVIKDLQKILKTSGHIDTQEKIIVFQGDHRIEVLNYLIKNNLAILENIKIRGY